MTPKLVFSSRKHSHQSFLEIVVGVNELNICLDDMCSELSSIIVKWKHTRHTYPTFLDVKQLTPGGKVSEVHLRFIMLTLTCDMCYII